MDAMTYLIAYVATAVVFFALDFLWLGTVANRFYRGQLGPLMAEQVNIPVAAAFYALYVVGLVIFSVAPALATGTWKTALMYGALFGFFAYATYDLTNFATIKGWTAQLAGIIPIITPAIDIEAAAGALAVMEHLPDNRVRVGMVEGIFRAVKPASREEEAGCRGHERRVTRTDVRVWRFADGCRRWHLCISGMSLLRTERRCGRL